MASMKKKMISSTLAATLVLSSAGIVALPGMAFANDTIATGVTSSKEMDASLQKLIDELTAIHTQLEKDPNGYAAVQTVLNRARSADISNWYQIVYNTTTPDANVYPNYDLVVQVIKNIISLTYSSATTSSDSLKADVETLKSNLQKLDTSITGTDIYNFYENFKSNLETQVVSNLLQSSTSHAQSVSFTAMIDTALEYAADHTQNTAGKYVFQKVLTTYGLHVSDLAAIRDRAEAAFDPSTTTNPTPATSALITAFASQYFTAQTATSLKVGDTQSYTLTINSSAGLPFKGAIDSSLVSWSSSNTDVAAFSTNGSLKALKAGSTTITASIHNYPVQKFTVTVSNATVVGGGGGGGGGYIPPSTSPTGTVSPTPTGIPGKVADLTKSAAITSTKDAAGNVTTTATIDAASIEAALTNNSAQNFTFNVGDATSSVVQLATPADAILKVAQSNSDSSFTLQTPLGALNVPVKALSTLDANSIATALGVSQSDVDLSKVTFNFVISKPQDSVNTAVSQAASKSGATVLSPTVDFTIQISLNGKSTELNNFGNVYLARTIPLNDGVDSTNAVGVRVHTDVQPDGTVKATFYPVPTVVTNGVVTLKRPGDSTYTVIKSNLTFSDISKDWAKDKINTLASKFVFNGYTDGTFRPESKITRAEFAAALVRALGLTADAPAATPFKDVKATDWESAYVLAASKAGLINGYGDHMFKPNANITRQEAATMIANAAKFLNLQTTSSGKTFKDQSKFPTWAKTSINTASALGILNGYNDGTFGPAKNTTRAEVSSMLLGLMKKANLSN